MGMEASFFAPKQQQAPEQVAPVEEESRIAKLQSMNASMLDSLTSYSDSILSRVSGVLLLLRERLRSGKVSSIALRRYGVLIAALLFVAATSGSISRRRRKTLAMDANFARAWNGAWGAPVAAAAGYGYEAALPMAAL